MAGSKEGRRKKISSRPRLGPGLFGNDARAVESFARAWQVLSQLPQDVAVDLRSNEWLENSIRQLARNYWSNKDEDALFSIGAAKKEVSMLVSRCDNLLSGLKTIKSNTRLMLSFEMGRISAERTIKELGEALRIFRIAGQRLTSDDFAREGSEAEISLCATLWAFRQRATGRRFKRTYDTNKDIVRYPSEAGFNSPDCMFVFELMRAIDPDIDLVRAEFLLRKAAQVVTAREARIEESKWLDSELSL